jgi:predicted transcriptional regulator
MEELKVNGHKVQMYDSIDEMPICRYHKFTQLMVLNSGLGSTMGDIENKLRELMKYIQTDKAKAQKELENLYQCINIINRGVNLPSQAMASLVYSIDGERCDDLTSEGLARTAKKLEEMKYSDLLELIHSIKKKLTKTYSRIFRTWKAT